MQQIIVLIVLLALMVPLSADAQDAQSEHFQDSATQSQKAATVFREIMDAPDSEIPRDILDDAECVMVFPGVVKAGYILGGRGGRGVASCRTPTDWSAPAFFNLGGASIGLQIGAQVTDFIFLIMNRDGMDEMLEDQFELGADASVAAGPVGRQAGASTNVRMDAKILSYSRSKGLFAGLELKGAVIEQDEENMEAVYGPAKGAKTVLQMAGAAAPSGVMALPQTLALYSTRTSTEDTSSSAAR
jgi:lipid-binding SYLF domain-containing protein